MKNKLPVWPSAALNKRRHSFRPKTAHTLTALVLGATFFTNTVAAQETPVNAEPTVINAVTRGEDAKHSSPSITAENGAAAAGETPSVVRNDEAALAPYAQPKTFTKATEVQIEYLDHRFFDRRYVDNYNIHVYEKVKDIHALSLYRGLTFSVADGHIIDDKTRRRRGGDAVGVGPSFLMRWEKHVSGKLYADLDASGSLRFFNKTHPAGGRPFGFLWRIGPRLTYRYTDANALSLGYMLAHASNGSREHNPGYDMVGFSLGFQHRF